MSSWLGQYCINVSDLERAVDFYGTLGIECASHTDIEQAHEAIVAHPTRGSRLQLAKQIGQEGAIDMGNAFWKLYVNTNDIATMYDAAVAAGHRSISPPQRLDRWPVTMAFIADPDGYLVELVQRHPWDDEGEQTQAWLGQYCINVTDIERTLAFYDTLGIASTSRTEIPDAYEAIVENPSKGSKLQLAEQKAQDGPIDMGTSMWKLYVYTDDIAATYGAAIDAGYESVMVPERLERWPVVVGFVADPDGYQVELVQRDP